MSLVQLVLAAATAMIGQLPSDDGTIIGVVVNATDQQPISGSEVVLRLRTDGRFLPVETTTTDAKGEFAFRGLPAVPDYQYLPGANRDGIHYPGPRVRLSPANPVARVRLEVCDSVGEPNPLVIRSHEIVIHPKPGLLSVTETILVENPGTTCYVGKAARQGAESVTLELAVPPEFERITFHEEFFGRRFSLVAKKLVTGIPFTPGRKELKFTYVIRNQDRFRVWQRPLDLPCSHVRISVHTETPDEVSCSLDDKPITQDGQVVFETSGQTLPAGHVIRVELGRLPVSFMRYAPYVAMMVLIALIGGASILVTRHPPTRRFADSALKKAG